MITKRWEELCAPQLVVALCAGAFDPDDSLSPCAVRSVTAAPAAVQGGSLFHRAHASIDVLYRELVKFGAVGALAFVVDIGVFNLMRTGIIGGDHGLAEKPLTAKSISVFVATVVAWLGNRYWTFRRRRRASARREFVLFGLMNVGGLTISLACLGTSHYVFGLTSTLADNIAGNVIGLGLGTLFRFWAYRQLVFTTEDFGAPEAPDVHTAAEDALAAGAGSAEAIVLDLRTHSRAATGEPGLFEATDEDGESPQRRQA